MGRTLRGGGAGSGGGALSVDRWKSGPRSAPDLASGMNGTGTCVKRRVAPSHVRPGVNRPGFDPPAPV